VLVRIDSDDGRSRHHRHSRSQCAVFRSKPFEVASTINFALPSVELRRGVDASREVPCAVRHARRLRDLPDEIPGAVLLDKRCQAANTTRIANVDGDGSGWPRVVTEDGRSTTGLSDRAKEAQSATRLRQQ